MNIKKIKGLMAENGHTQKDLANILGISECTVKNKLLGKSDFKFSEVVLIANHYNVDINIFLPISSQNGN